MFLRGGGGNAPEGAGIIGPGTCLIVLGFVDRSIGAGGDGCFVGFEDGHFESSCGLSGGCESVRRGGRPGRISAGTAAGPG